MTTQNTNQPCPNCGTYCYGDCGYQANTRTTSTTQSTAQQNPHAALLQTITDAGHTYNFWQKGSINRLYINDGKKSLGFINLATMRYEQQRREGTTLWSILRKANLITG